MTPFQKLVQKRTIRVKQDCVKQICSDLAAFQLLDKRRVELIGKAVAIDAIKLCDINGITYTR